MKIFRWMVGTACVGLVGGFLPAIVQAQTGPEPARVELGQTTLNLEVGDTVQLEAKVFEDSLEEVALSHGGAAQSHEYIGVCGSGEMVPDVRPVVSCDAQAYGGSARRSSPLARTATLGRWCTETRDTREAANTAACPGPIPVPDSRAIAPSCQS